MPAGYSTTPLVNKLGIKPGTRIVFVEAPPHYRRLLGELPTGLAILRRPGKQMDFIHYFCTSLAALRRRFPALKRALAFDGALWVSWPKKTSKLSQDLSEADVRGTGLSCGLVDVKICAVDEDWSGLKFVYRLEDRH